MSEKRGFIAWLKHAFSMEGYTEPFTEQEIALLDRIAVFMVRKRMTVPALLFIEMGRPLNFVGSQALTFFEPIVKAVFEAKEYAELQRILERRESIDVLLERIEYQSNERDRRLTEEAVSEIPGDSTTEPSSEPKKDE